MTSEVGACPTSTGRHGKRQMFFGVGVFACTDGNVEPFEFADIGCTATAGLSLRDQPVATNPLGQACRADLNADGLSILVGDEQIRQSGA
jgi:hypothetical protein